MQKRALALSGEEKRKEREVVREVRKAVNKGTANFSRKETHGNTFLIQ